MRILITFAITLLLSLAISGGVWAANLDGHMQYRIISYSFNSNSIDQPNGGSTSGPLLITGATSDVFTQTFDNETILDTDDPQSIANIFGVSADYMATPDLAFYGAFGITKNTDSSALDSDYSASWEANVGAIYRLFNNIKYEVHFGYMDTGDLFKESNAYTDVESIIMISNKLTMSF